MSKRIIFIVEGGDGSGKSSAFQNMQQQLSAHQHNMLVVREPGGTKIGEDIRNILSTEYDEPMSLATEHSLLWAGRFQLYEEKALPFLFEADTEHRAVFFDRSFPSTFAYQIHGRQATPATRDLYYANLKFLMHTMNKVMQGKPFEIHHVYFRISPAVSVERCQAREKDDEPKQFDGLDCQRRVVEGYREFYDTLSGDTEIRQSNPKQFVHYVDAERSQQEVLQQLLDIVKEVTEGVLA